MPYVASLPISTARVQEAKRDRKNLQRCTRLVEECATAMLHSRDSKLSMALATALHVNTLLRELMQMPAEDREDTDFPWLTRLLQHLLCWGDQYVASWCVVLLVLEGGLPSEAGWTSAMPAWSPWTGLAPPEVPQIIPRQ